MTEPLFDALNDRAALVRDLLGGFGSGVRVGDLYDAMVGNSQMELLEAQRSAIAGPVSRMPIDVT